MHLLTTSPGIQITFLKRYPTVSIEDLHHSDRYDLRPSDAPLLIRSFEEFEDNTHYKINLRQSVKGFFEWFVYIPQVQVLDPPKNWIVPTTQTVIKTQPVSDARTLPDDQKFNLALGAQPIFADWVKPIKNGHYEFMLEKPRNGVHNWFAFADAVEVEGQPLLVSTPVT